MEEYRNFWLNYLKIDGTASRIEFWLPTVMNAFVLFVLGLVAYALPSGIGMAVLIISFLYIFAIIIPQITALIRRLHDTDKSGWYMVWGLFPVIGSIIIFLALIQE